MVRSVKDAEKTHWPELSKIKPLSPPVSDTVAFAKKLLNRGELRKAIALIEEETGMPVTISDLPGADKNNTNWHIEKDQFEEKIRIFEKEVKSKFDHATDAARYAAPEQKEENTQMSNKFLPFVVESSTPVHIFKTILRNSKGMNRVTIGSIFYLTLEINIKTLRYEVKQFPDLSLEAVYEKLLQVFPSYRIDERIINMFDALPIWFPEGAESGWAEELNQFGMRDTMLFFAALSMSDKPITEYTNIPFKDILPGKKSNKVLENIRESVELSDSEGLTIEVKNKNELCAFLLYQSLICPTVDPGSAAMKIKIVVNPDAA